MDMSNYCLNIDNLSVSYSRQQEIIDVLKELNFDLETGVFSVIVGPSGCGKTTLLMAIADLIDKRDLAYLSGEIKVFGNSQEFAKKQRAIGVAFQSPALLPWLTVEDNIKLPLILGHQSNILGNSLPINELLEFTGLTHFRGFYPAQLSGGLAQRANLARSLILRPQLLLLDEPVGQLDYLSRNDLLKLIRRIHNESKLTTLMVTHDLREAAQVADCVYVFNKDFPTYLTRIDIRKKEDIEESDLLIDTEKIVNLEKELINHLINIHNIEIKEN